MKRIITTTAIFISLMICVSSAVLADNDEFASSARRSPLMLNYYPTKGMIISDTNYSEIENKSSFKTTLKNIEQGLRYGITDQTEISVKQAYAIGVDVDFSGFGKSYLEIGEFYNPVIGVEHRLDFSDSKNIYAVGLNVRPEVSYSGYSRYWTEQAVFSKFSWQAEDDFWLGVQGQYLNSYQEIFYSNTEKIELQINASKIWDRTSALLSVNLSKRLDFTAKKFFNSPNLIDRYESDISPKIIGGLSYKFNGEFYAVIDYSWQSLRNTVTTFFQNVNYGSSTSTRTIQTITARLIKEF
jgi:hypothetical protein